MEYYLAYTQTLICCYSFFFGVKKRHLYSNSFALYSSNNSKFISVFVLVYILRIKIKACLGGKSLIEIFFIFSERLNDRFRTAR
jgi:hypothetical protein